MRKYMQYSTTQLSEIARQSKTKQEFINQLGYQYYKTSYVKDIIKHFKKNYRKPPDLLTKDKSNNPQESKKIREFKRINYGKGCSICHKTEWQGKQIPLTLMKEKDENETRYLGYVCSNCWRIMREHGINFENKNESQKDLWTDFSKEDIEKSIEKSRTYYQILQNLGIKHIKNSQLFALIIRCDEENIEVPWDDKTYEERVQIFSPRIKKLSNEAARMMFLTRKLFKKYRCCKCGSGPTNEAGLFLPLQIWHKNGNCSDNNLDNLDLICPNCYDLKRKETSNNRFEISKEDKRIF